MRVGRRIAEPDGESLLAIREQALVAGVPEEQAARVAAEAWNEALERVGPRMLRTLHRTAPRMLRRERWARQRFQRRIRRYWGRALDRYIMVTAAAEDCGRAFHVRNRTAAVAIDDYRFEALTGLHARACRIAKEIDRLLSGGFAKGALARCRTLHELAVTAEVIATYGRAEGDYADLTERFVRHEAVTAYKDVLEYQQHRDVLGYEPFDDAAVAALKAESDEVIRRFGAGYGRSYGWARPLFDKNDPTFRDLEQLAELSHLRSHYRWASAEIHAGAKEWALN